MKRTLITFILLAAMSAIALAESSDCHNPGGIVPDGRPTYVYSTFPSDARYYWRFKGQAGHSYSVELNYDFNDSQAADGPKSTMVIYGPSDLVCSHNSTLDYAWIGDHAPTLLAPSHRYAFVAPADGIYAIEALQQHGHSGVFSLRIVDTTLFNPRWSTYANFSTQ